MHYASDKHAAFSLVELSIVLVILGLLVGGILTGQSLIHAAQLRTITTERDQLSTAIHTFKEKYLYLPGDLPNATDFWGALDVDPVWCQTTSPSAPKTCNGDGNGKVERVLNHNEDMFFFGQLRNAGLIAGQVNGGFVMDNSFELPAKFGNGASWYAIGYKVAPNSSTSQFGGTYSNSIFFQNFIFTLYNLTTTDAWNIDTKIDNGLPGTGTIISNKGNWGWGAGGLCTTQAGQMSDSGATYDFTQSGMHCALIFLNMME